MIEEYKIIEETEAKEVTIDYQINRIGCMITDDGMVFYVRDDLGRLGGMRLNTDEMDKIVLLMKKAVEGYADWKGKNDSRKSR